MYLDEHEEEIKRLEMQSYRWRRILVFLPGILVLATLAWLFLRPGGLLRWEEERWTHTILSTAQKLLRDVPPPPGAVLIYERYGACWPWRVGSVYALYTTDDPWVQVWSHYKDKAASSGWSASCDDGQDRLACRSTASAYDLRSLSLNVIDMDRDEGRYLPPGVIEGAGQLGTTVYRVDFYFAVDQSFSHESDPCPTFWEICVCRPWSYWERSWAGWRPVTLPPAPTHESSSYPEPPPLPRSGPDSTPYP